MVNFKQEIARSIAQATNIEQKIIEIYIEKPKDTKNGDYAFPCFKLAKELKKSQIQIAEEIKQKIKVDEKIVEKVEVVSRIFKLLHQQKITCK